MMVRLSRAEQQELNRRKVLTAAREEFAEHGFHGTTVDGIAVRAELTRGAVYSNFPSKRAVYFAVLADEAERAPSATQKPPGITVEGALELFAAISIDPLPRSSDYVYQGMLQLRSPMLGIDLIPELMSDESLRGPFAQLIKFDAILLGMALEALATANGSVPRRWINTAECVLTMLYGSTQLSFVAPGFTSIANILTVCSHMPTAGLEEREWAPPEGMSTLDVAEVDESWDPPQALDIVRGTSARLEVDGVVAIFGVDRLTAVEALVRVQPPAGHLTVVIVVGDTAELSALARLTIADLTRSLRSAFPETTWPRFDVVVDETRTVATACGIGTMDNDTEAAVRISRGRITSRVLGPLAGHSLTSIAVPSPFR
ncbi:TetR/AcrR family transcriptional regulator [Nocardia sp. NPDC057668]|uniref:TetR/AcrR family transcriptional regulator n=1 Tax=Nocardia sp. NPDC057668 TaxID=3346202 RepID=UPI00366B89AD